MGFTDYLVVEWSPTTDPLATPSWEDITPLVRSVSAQRGYGSLIDTFSAGRATVVANNGSVSVESWLNVSASYKWRQMRIRHIASDWFVFSGYIRQTIHGWDQTPQQRTVTFELTDLWGLLASATVKDPDTYFGGSPLGEVFQASYDNKSGWVTNGGPLDVATWVFGQIGVTLTSTDAHCHEYLFVPSDLRGPALSVLSNYLEAGLERVEIGADGTPTLRGRWDPLIDYLSATRPVFSTDETIDPGSYKYLRGTLSIAEPDRDYFDEAAVQGVEGDPVTVTVTPTNWPATAYTRTQTPIADTNWSRATAEMVIREMSGVQAYPQRIVCSLAGPKATSVDATHPMLTNYLGSALVVQQAEAGSVSWAVQFLEVQHDIDAKEGWKATGSFASQEAFNNLDQGNGGLYQLGVSTLGDGLVFAP